MYLKELRTKESGRLQQCQGFAGNLGDVLAHLLTSLSKMQLLGWLRHLHTPVLFTHTGHSIPHPWGGYLCHPHLLSRHVDIPLAFLQFSHRGKPTGGLEMVLTNCLFLFRLTGFRPLRHRGMWLFHFAFVFWFLHLFYKANKGGKKPTNQP